MIQHEAGDYLNILFGTTVRMTTNIKTVVPRHKEHKCYIFHCAPYGFLALNSNRKTRYEVTFHNAQCLILKHQYSSTFRYTVSNSACKAQKIELQNLLDCFSKEYLHMVALLSVTSVIAVWKHIVWMICTVSHYSWKFLSVLFIWDSYPLYILKDFMVPFFFSFPFFGCPYAIEYSISTACFSIEISVNWKRALFVLPLAFFYSVTIKHGYVHRLQPYMHCTQINTNTHAHTDVHIQNYWYHLFQVARVAKSSSDKCFLWIIIGIYKQTPFCPLVLQNTVLNFSFLDVALCWSLSCLFYFKSYLKISFAA